MMHVGLYVRVRCSRTLESVVYLDEKIPTSFIKTSSVAWPLGEAAAASATRAGRAAAAAATALSTGG